MIHSSKGNPFQLAFNLGSLRFKALETSVTDEPGTWIGTGEFERNRNWRQNDFQSPYISRLIFERCIPFTSLSKIKEWTTAYMNYVILIGNDSEKLITENKSKHQNLGSRHTFKNGLWVHKPNLLTIHVAVTCKINYMKIHVAITLKINDTIWS